VIPGKRYVKIEFPAAKRAETVFRSFYTVEHIAGRAPGLTDCIVGLRRHFLGKVSQILVKLQLLPDHPSLLQ
jgi:hypothetical protein